MRALKESSGINIDITSRTVTLIGDDVIDMIFSDALSNREVTAEDVTAIALSIVMIYRPDYVDDGIGKPWSLGALPDDIAYLMTKLPSTFESVEFKTDGGVYNGPV